MSPELRHGLVALKLPSRGSTDGVICSDASVGRNCRHLDVVFYYHGSHDSDRGRGTIIEVDNVTEENAEQGHTPHIK